MYLINLMRHKWFVFLEACKLGIPLLGLIHDMSKFLPDEFIPYARYDFNKFEDNAQEYQGPFNMAWLKHQKRNKHHWQYWLLINDSGRRFQCENGDHLKQVIPLPMPKRYIKEMVADWRGAARARGNPDTFGWYVAQGNIILHPETRAEVEKLLEDK